MLLTYRIISSYLWQACRAGVSPWRYLQLNSEYFNSEKGFFSKIETNQLVPKQWRLEQYLYDPTILPDKFPAFIKPEWGQNASGVMRIDDKSSYLRLALKKPKIALLVQEAGLESREFEVFFASIGENENRSIPILKIIEIIDPKGGVFPIHSVYNKDTLYLDRTNSLGENGLAKIKKIVNAFPPFRLCRIGLKANSVTELLEGSFHVVEINLFAPFPFNLLDKNTSIVKKREFIRMLTKQLVQTSKKIPKVQFKRFVLSKIIWRHFQARRNL